MRHITQQGMYALFGLAVLAVILPAAGEPAFAQTVRYVDADATGPTLDGASWCSAFTSPQDALAVASFGDEIRVANGTYKPDQGAGQTAGDRTASFYLVNGVALRGGYAGCGAADPNVRNFATFETILSGDLSGDDAPDTGAGSCAGGCMDAIDGLG